MTIKVPLAERSYDIVIENGALHRVLELSGDLSPDIAILTNQTLAPLYAEPLAGDLRAAGHRVLLFAQPEGEKYKSSEWLVKAWDALADFGLSRSGLIFAVGGGVVGDWAGFVAATYMRGVGFIQVPTTLLAMVDSSVGGKTGINHPRAKNLIGAFHQPHRVLIDPQVLQTLPPRELRAGLAEVIKYGVIADENFFAWLEENIESALNLQSEVIEKIIARSCEIKAEVVGQDERESDSVGRRAILNYGHTVGHAIEATTAYGEFLHGEAIAIGMQVAARLALKLGTIEYSQGEDLLRRQTQLFERTGLPVRVPDVPFETLWAAMTLDKKSRGDKVNFILPSRIGDVTRANGVAPDVVKQCVDECR
jgi:3-dehydroquinate synthase